MFDSNLSLESAQQLIGSAEEDQSLQYAMDPETIARSRNIDALRQQCFESKQSFDTHWVTLQQQIKEVFTQYESSPPFTFLHKNFPKYTQANGMPRDLAMQSHRGTWHVLSEAILNAMSVSNRVDATVTVTKSGVLFVINQHQMPFQKETLQKMNAKSAELHSRLSVGENIASVIQNSYNSMRTLIGYTPPANVDPAGGLYHRGNGLGQMIINQFVRVNFLPEDTDNKTVGIHTVDQAVNAARLIVGDRGAIRGVYAPSAAPINRNVIDELFANGLDFSDLF